MGKRTLESRFESGKKGIQHHEPLNPYYNKNFNSTVSEDKYTRRDNRSLEERFDSGKRGILHHEPLNPNYSKTFREEQEDKESQPFWSRAWNAL